MNRRSSIKISGVRKASTSDRVAKKCNIACAAVVDSSIIYCRRLDKRVCRLVNVGAGVANPEALTGRWRSSRSISSLEPRLCFLFAGIVTKASRFSSCRANRGQLSSNSFRFVVTRSPSEVRRSKFCKAGIEVKVFPKVRARSERKDCKGLNIPNASSSTTAVSER